MTLPDFGAPITRSNPIGVDDLSNVVVVNPAQNDILIYDGIDTWRNRTLGFLLQQLLRAGTLQWRSLNVGAGWFASTVGTGTTSQFIDRLSVTSGGGAGGTGSLRSTSSFHFSLGQTADVIDWTKAMLWVFVLSAIAGTPNGVSRISIGKTGADGITNLVRKGLGIRMDNFDLKGQAHDGTALTTIDLGVTLSANIAVKIAILSDGQGNITWSVDQDGAGLVEVGSTAAGPAVLGTALESVVQYEAENGIDAANQGLAVGDVKYFMEQA